jgi:predicted PurR-regulated permease PerM
MWDWLWYGSVNAFFMAGQGLTVVFLTLFLLIEGDSFKRKLVRRIDGLGNRRITVQVFNAIADQMHRFIWVQILTSGLVAVATGLALWWLGMEQPAVWGVFAGVMNIVPYFGPLVVTVVLTLVAFLQFSSLEMAVQVAGITLVITTIEGMALTPHLISRSASINHVALFLALAFWSWAWGGPGLLLAVPLLMMVKAVCDHVPGLDGLADFLGTTPDEPRPVETRQADGVGIGSSRA